MLKTVTNIAVFGAFVIVVGFLGIVLWQSLFGSEEIEEQGHKPQAAQTEQQRPNEQAPGTSASPRAHNPTENAAKESADVARDAVRLAGKTAERQLRAYIYIFPVTIVTLTPRTPIMVALSMKNYGVTPTRKGRVKFGFAVMPSNAANDYTVSEADMIVSDQAIGVPSTGSGDAVPLRLADKDAKALTQEQFENIRDRRYVAVVKGTFIYEDIFGIERHTWFCYAFDWERITKYTQLSPDKQVLGTAGAVYCKYGNEED